MDNMRKFHVFCQGLLLSCIIAIVSLSRHSVPLDECTQSGSSLICDHDIPNRVPDGVTNVYIKDYNKSWPDHYNVFDDHSWSFVTKLDIIVNPKALLDISETAINHKSKLYNLKNLKTLGIHGRHVHFGNYNFKAMDSVTHLDLADCISLSESDVVQLLSRNETLPNLKYLNLARLKTRNGEFLSFSKSFLNMLVTKSVEMLGLSGTNIAITDVSLLQRNFSLIYLDVSNTTIAVTNNSDIYTGLKSFLANTKTINMSYAFGRYIQFHEDIQNCNYTLNCKHGFLSFNLEHIYMNHIYNIPIYMNNCFYNVSRCSVKQLKTLHLRGNNIRKLNVTVTLPRNTGMTELDLSSNGMVYLSPKCIMGFKAVKILLISNNSLFEMEHFREFGDLLRTFIFLEHLNIAYNRLTIIPKRMFINNRRMKIIDLEGNRIQSIMFQLKHLTELQILDLRKNQILYLKGEGLLQVQRLLLSGDRKNGNSSKINIQVKGNPFECSCESLEFIKWLDNYLQPYTHSVYQCNLEGDAVDINTAVVEKTNHLCYRTGIISAVSISLFVVCVIIMGSIARRIYMVRKRQQIDETKLFLDDFKKGLFEENYLAFLSHSSDDGNLVMGYMFHQLDNTLRHMLGLEFDKDIICIGDIHFRPGIPLINEIMRCVSESLVMIFVISRSFCRSPWCRMELKEAYEQEKPIILVFKEQVDLGIMPQYLSTILQRYARAKLVCVNGQMEIIPGWQTFCESVIFLACKKQKQQNIDAENTAL